MNINIENAIKFPFKDSNWKKKLGILSLAYFIPFVILLGLMVVGYLIFILGVTTEDAIAPYGVGLIILSLLGFLAYVGIILVGIYFSGYGIDISRNVLNGEPDYLPELKPIGARLLDGLKYGLASFLPSFAVNLILGIILFVILGGLGLLMNSVQANDSLLLILTLVMYVFAFLYYGIMFVSILLITPVANYNYLKYGFGAAVRLKDFGKIVKYSWKQMLLIYALLMAGSMVVTFLAYIPVVGWVVFAGLFSYIALVYYHLMGQLALHIESNLNAEVK
jgi:hypothetical protein